MSDSSKKKREIYKWDKSRKGKLRRGKKTWKVLISRVINAEVKGQTRNPFGTTQSLAVAIRLL